MRGLSEAQEEARSWLTIRHHNAAAMSLMRFMQKHEIDFLDELGSLITTVVYFIQANASKGRGPIKIGVSYAPSIRLANLQTGCPYPIGLLGTIRGGRNVERALHLMFHDRRLSGEWFKPNRRMQRFISELLSTAENHPVSVSSWR